MVGRELLTMCPAGEDHQGHDWGGKGVVYMVYTSRGTKTIVFKKWARRTKIIFYGTIHVMLTKWTTVSILMNFYLMV